MRLPRMRRAAFWLRLGLFPWFLWHVSGALPHLLRRTRLSQSPWGGGLIVSLHLCLYLGTGLPVTLLLFGEGVITLNEALLAEPEGARRQSDFTAGMAGRPFEVPGPASYRPPPVAPQRTEDYRRYLVELYAPVIYQKISTHPEWDIPLLIHFDGNDDPRDNVVNEPQYRPHIAGIHGEVTAETADAYYLTYSLYHVKDYDHPLRQMLSRMTYHDNDNEGFHMRVDKQTMQIVEVETWLHNRFLLFNLTGVSTGTEPVHGTFYVEDGTHVILYAHSLGHGVRCAQRIDLPSLGSRVKILRFRGDRAVVRVHTDASVQVDTTYEIAGFDPWYAYARGPFTQHGQGQGMFEDVLALRGDASGGPWYLGRFIAGRDYAIGSWARPKPMWSWDDIWDALPSFVWHFFPSISFQSHGGTFLSHHYLYDRPCEKIFGVTAGVVPFGPCLSAELQHLGLWHQETASRGVWPHEMLQAVGMHYLKQYVNYLFHALK